MGNYYGDRIKGSEYARVRNRWCLITMGVFALFGLPIIFSPGARRFQELVKEGYFDDSDDKKKKINHFFGHTNRSMAVHKRLAEEAEGNEID